MVDSMHRNQRAECRKSLNDNRTSMKQNAID